MSTPHNADIIGEGYQPFFYSSVKLNFSLPLPVSYSFLRSFGSSSLTFITLALAAFFDPQVDLKEKLLIQSSGIGHLLDTYSDAAIVLVFLYQVLSAKFEWCMTPKPLKMSYAGAILFGIVATYFHAMGVEESGEEPHPFYSCYFMSVGAFTIFWQARGLIDKCSPPLRKDLITKAKARFVCLAILPSLLNLLGASGAVNRFAFNGWATLYAAIALDPILKETLKGATPRSSLKFKTIRIIFPLSAFGLFAESMVAEWLKVDPHIIVHVLSFSYVMLMHSCLVSTGDAEKGSRVHQE